MCLFLMDVKLISIFKIMKLGKLTLEPQLLKATKLLMGFWFRY
jgi:hypothetical protein